MNGEIHLFVDPSKVTSAVKQHLNLEADIEMKEHTSSPTTDTVLAVLHPYEDVDGFLAAEVHILVIITKKDFLLHVLFVCCSLFCEFFGRFHNNQKRFG